MLSHYIAQVSVIYNFIIICKSGPSVLELRQTKVEIISNNICNRREVYNGAITLGMLCAGYLEGGSDACQVGLISEISRINIKYKKVKYTYIGRLRILCFCTIYSGTIAT